MNAPESNLPLWLALLALSEQATTDQLTGLRNRRYFEEALADQLALANRCGRPLSLALFDLNELKAINGKKGYPAGDEALKTVAKVLSETARSVDIHCRYGGDEFAVILPRATTEEAEHFIRRVQKRLENCGIGITAGVAALPSSNLIATADIHLRDNKQRSSYNIIPQNVSKENRDASPIISL